jgi:tetratricopeptide (TPR) repeat protein
MAEQDSVNVLLSNAYESLTCVDLQAASEFLDKALAEDFEHPEVLWSLKCANFWSERLGRLESIQNAFERGEYVLAQWKAFTSFSAKLGVPFDRPRYAFKGFAFAMALSQYKEVPAEGGESESPDVALRVGMCLKGMGDYSNALRSLETAARARRDDPEVLAQLADAYALSGDERSSKALFREAFFLGAQRVDIDFIECEMIRRLAAKVASLGYSEAELLEWMPVYGTLLGLFSVKRELKTIEVGKLKQSIYQLENEVREGRDERNLLVPRLITRYFWLIDYYVQAKEDRSKLAEVLLKIKLLDPSIHKQYTA